MKVYFITFLNEHYDIDRVELINVEELNDNQRRLLSEGGVCGTSVGYFINVNTTTEYVGMHTLIKNILLEHLRSKNIDKLLEI